MPNEMMPPVDEMDTGAPVIEEGAPMEEATPPMETAPAIDPAIQAILDKYGGDVNEIAKAHTGLQDQYGKQSNELGELRKQISEQELRNQIRAEIQRAQQVQQGPPPRDFDAELAALDAAFEDGMPVQEYNRKFRDITMAQAANVANQVVENKSMEEFAKSVDNQFLDSNPMFRQLYQTGGLNNIVMSDPHLSKMAQFDPRAATIGGLYKAQADEATMKLAAATEEFRQQLAVLNENALNRARAELKARAGAAEAGDGIVTDSGASVREGAIATAPRSDKDALYEKALAALKDGGGAFR